MLRYTGCWTAERGDHHPAQGGHGDGATRELTICWKVTLDWNGMDCVFDWAGRSNSAMCKYSEKKIGHVCEN